MAAKEWKYITLRYDPQTEEGRQIDEWKERQTNVSESIRGLILGRPLEEEDLSIRIEELEKRLEALSISKVEPRPLPKPEHPKQHTGEGVAKFFED